LKQTPSIDGPTRLLAAGDWTALNASQLEKLVDDLLNQPNKADRLIIEMTRLTGFDSFGAWLLERLRRDLEARGNEVEIAGLNQDGLRLFGEMETTNRTTETDTQRRSEGRGPLNAFGRAMVEFFNDLRAFAHMLGAIVMAFWEMVQHPRNFRLTAAVHQLDRVGLQAVPIILLITFLIGAIIAQQGFFHFHKFGADLYVVDMVGILVLREIGVLLVAIMVAGRSGSAYTAELGSMKMREEVDALKTMGFDPVAILILPRILVLIIAMPMLTFVGSMAALYGGGLVAALYGGMTPDLFIDRLKEAISLTHFKVGMIKAPFMGAVIGVIACTEGLRVKGSAASLGQQTTRSVVKAIFMVIVLDGLFAIFFAAVGM
jgi:phospholipid/cholesterol/gamma-HCH transport system permease protein